MPQNGKIDLLTFCLQESMTLGLVLDLTKDQSPYKTDALPLSHRGIVELKQRYLTIALTLIMF
jgi:hypothetical protein